MGKSKKYMQNNITFLRLIKDYKITVPVIQRDYAQGRSTPKETEIRDGFLSAIIDVLQGNEEKLLVLDFIYGSTTVTDNIFTPLDGQQRLTTLFLIHWYLFDSDALKQLVTNDENSVFSKFSYETRISSKNFCDKLVQKEYSTIKQSFIEISQERDWTLSSSIKDQPWFLWAWQKDPTVSSMLVMLDDIESRLSRLAIERRKEFADRLKYIVFHLLPLEQFNLTDELYVKMNARGKELSIFDILKSTLEEQMRLNSVNEKIQHTWQTNFDSSWMDIFWNKIAKSKLEENDDDSQDEAVQEVELAYLRFLTRMMTYHLFTNDNLLKFDWKNEAIKRYVPFSYTESDSILNKLREYSIHSILKLIPLFCKVNFFDESFFDFIVKTFESLIFNDKEVTDLVDDLNFEHGKNSLFEEFISKEINYDTRVQFFAILKFFEYNQTSSVLETAELKKELNSWMRVIRNLSTNTNTYYYNNYEDFLKSLTEIQKWSEVIYSKGSLTILAYLSDTNNKLSGFDGSQLKEEQEKAKLTLKSDEWASQIIKAEEHKYFLGQIRFLLNWSKDENGDYQLNKFKNYLEKIKGVFDNNGLTTQLKENHLFKNSLMCIDSWYLLLDICFVKFDNNKDRDWSWKRYLREESKAPNIKNVLKNWNIQEKPDIKLYLKEYVEANKPTDWRKYFIEFPEIYDSLYDKKISWWYDEGKKTEFCLLSKTRWNSRHKELASYYWFLKYQNSDNDEYLDSTNEIHSFSAVFRRDNNKEFYIKYLPKWENGWKQGQYVISSNFDSSAYGMQHNIENGRWEISFKTDAKDEVEILLQKLNN